MIDRFLETRRATLDLCSPLETDDYGAQSCHEASPVKWHLAHSTWFFERFVLRRWLAGYCPWNLEWDAILNSYYETVGPVFDKARRGSLTRPTLDEVLEYRSYVERAMSELLGGPPIDDVALAAVRLGIEHECQHQELLLTDVKHLFWSNPLRPVYRHTHVAAAERDRFHELARREGAPWARLEGGLVRVGHAGPSFCFDNEAPRHPVALASYRLSPEPVTNGEFLEFIEAGGYSDPRHWLSDGWAQARREGWQAPLYWERQGPGHWSVMTLGGMRRVDEREPVCHVSYYEADAFARFKGQRLPTEAEWEHAAAAAPVEGNLLESGHLHPSPHALASATGPLSRLFGDVWEWTASAYLPYPGFAPLPGAFGEYNGKFMSNRMVLRGGSCATPTRHLRATYRNFFEPGTRWQFSGFRLAERDGRG